MLGGGTCGAPVEITSLPFEDVGTTSGLENTVPTLPLACNGNYTTVNGPDTVYSLTVGANSNVTFLLTTESLDYDPSIYLLATCGQGASCITGADNCFAANAPGNPCGGISDEEFSVSGLSAGTYFFYVDSFYSVGGARAAGPFSLEVTGSLGDLPSFEPAALAVDPLLPSLGSADGNGVLEPAEQVTLAPSWHNSGAAAGTIDGTGDGFSGPAGPVYELADGSASYGAVAPSGTASCLDEGDCYAVGVSGDRPAPHWDAEFQETLQGFDGGHTWVIHIGDSFTDVPRSHPFYKVVETMLHRGVTSGCGSGNYCPGNTVSRAQMAPFLLRALEGPEYTPPACEGVFSDVVCPSAFADWIEELFDRGVTGGCQTDPLSYCPGTAVNRAQMSVFLLTALEGPGYTPPDCSGVFGDVACPSTFANWIEDLAARGITTGCGGGNFCPGGVVARSQMAAFLSVAFELALYGP